MLMFTGRNKTLLVYHCGIIEYKALETNGYIYCGKINAAWNNVEKSTDTLQLIHNKTQLNKFLQENMSFINKLTGWVL